MATVLGEGDDAFHSAACVRHPNGTKELQFCFDCSRVLCSECRSIEIDHVNHLTHSTAPLQEVLTQRKERMPPIRKLIEDFSIKHEVMKSALLKLEEEQTNQTQEMNRIIDNFFSELSREIENIHTEAKATIAKRIAEIWSASPADMNRKQIDTELQKTHEVRARIDHEVRLCDRDELYLVEKNKDLESYATELSEFNGKTFEIPDSECYQLRDLRRELRDRMSQFQRELKRTKDAFLNGLQVPFPFPHPDQLSLLSKAVIIYPKEKLLSSRDTGGRPVVRGAVPSSGDGTEAICFVDSTNCKIKMLNLKTRQLAELFAGPSGTHLWGLANVEGCPDGPLIATTEHTEHTSDTPARVRLLLLRRNASQKRLDVVQSVSLEEPSASSQEDSHSESGFFSQVFRQTKRLFSTVSSGSKTSIAQVPGGNLFCGITGSGFLHELCRSADASATPFASTARTHRLPAAVRSICSLQSNGECRLAASLCDDTVRVFRVAGGTLKESQRVAQPRANWRPHELVALPGGSLTLRSYFWWNPKWVFGIECCAAQPDGSLAAPQLLHAQELQFDLIGLLPPTDSYSTFRITSFNGNRELCLHPIKPN